MLGVVLGSLFTAVDPGFAQGTAFNYDGRLNDSGTSAAGPGVPARSGFARRIMLRVGLRERTKGGEAKSTEVAVSQHQTEVILESIITKMQF